MTGGGDRDGRTEGADPVIRPARIVAVLAAPGEDGARAAPPPARDTGGASGRRSPLERGRVGRYRVTGLLGEGAMAAVYAGEQEGEPREVAIKVMHPHLALDGSFARRFGREARTARRVEHPNVVRVLELGEDEGTLFIAMERVRGKDLSRLLEGEARLAERRAAAILIEVAGALSAAHSAGVVHRDLKPDNVMLLEGGTPEQPRVKVLDFGIAKLLDLGGAGEVSDGAVGSFASSAGPTALTRAGLVIGTPAYMSPEQCAGRPLDGRSDLYAAGVLLFQLVTGSLPFDAEIAAEIALKHVHEAPPTPRAFLPTIHPGLEALLLACLAKDPAARPPSAEAFAAALYRLLPELPSEPFRGQPLARPRGPRGTDALQVLAPPGPGPRPIRSPDPGPPSEAVPTHRAPRGPKGSEDADIRATLRARDPRGVVIEVEPTQPGPAPLLRGALRTTLVTARVAERDAPAPTLRARDLAAPLHVPLWVVSLAFLVGTALGALLAWLILRA